MDSQVKERLVGAAVLVALGVWLIPIVLDGPNEPGASNPAADGASLELPAADESGAPIRTETVELDSSTRRTVTPPPRSGAADLTSADVADEQAVAVVVPSAASAAPEAGATRSPTADAGTSTRSTAATAPATASGDWMIQLGSFGEAANAERLASRISTFGYRPTISAYRSGDRMLHRVRIGGFESRNTAEAAVASLSAHGFVAQVVSPE